MRVFFFEIWKAIVSIWSFFDLAGGDFNGVANFGLLNKEAVKLLSF